jgi:DNA-binding MarR family transcriptional regulator
VSTEQELSGQDYRALARFRYLIRHFLQFSEAAARGEGLEAQQHQMMLAIRAAEEAGGPTIGRLAEQLFIRHHSAVGLADRLEEHGLVARHRSEGDRRQVRLRLTERGEQVLEHLTQSHQAELRKLGPELVNALAGLLQEVGTR